MSGAIWVVAEQWRGRISPITFESLALGREVADALETPLVAVLMGHQASGLAEKLGRADAVLYLDHPALAEPVAGTYAAALWPVAREREPACILIPLTNVSLGFGTLLAAKLRAPGVNFCRDLSVSGGVIQARCVMYGGKMESLVTSAVRPFVAGIWPGSRPVDPGMAAGAPPLEEIPVQLPELKRVELRRYIEPEAGDIDITQQDVLVAVGRGIQAKENLEIAERVAELLGGAVCGSRPVIDQGWLPLPRQVGKSGMTVKPKLYLALGVSGAPEHVEGMKDSGLIIAVNTDPQAPIFQLAHYGVVADALDIMPALEEAIGKRKQVSSHA